MAASDEDLTAIALAAQLIGAELADDNDDLLGQILAHCHGTRSEVRRLAYALAARRGDTLRVGAEETGARLLYKVELLGLLVWRGVDPCRLASTVFRDRADHADLTLLVVTQARKQPDFEWLPRSPWRAAWPYPPAPAAQEPPEAVAASPDPSAAQHPQARPAAPTGATQACMRGVHSLGPAFRQGPSLWASCTACGTTMIAPPAAGVGAFDFRTPQPIEYP